MLNAYENIENLVSDVSDKLAAIISERAHKLSGFDGLNSENLESVFNEVHTTIHRANFVRATAMNAFCEFDGSDKIEVSENSFGATWSIFNFALRDNGLVTEIYSELMPKVSALAGV